MSMPPRLIKSVTPKTIHAVIILFSPTKEAPMQLVTMEGMRATVDIMIHLRSEISVSPAK